MSGNPRRDDPNVQRLLKHLRPIALALPEAVEGESIGHPSFLIRDKFFVLIGNHDSGKFNMCAKVGKDALDVFCRDPRYYKAPYIGNHGWVCLRLEGDLDWEEIAGVVRGSYRLVAPKSLARQVTE